MFEKSRGNLYRVRKFAEGPSADSPSPEPAQPRWAARLLASPHRAGSSSSALLAQADLGEGSDASPALNAVLDFQISESRSYHCHPRPLAFQLKSGLPWALCCQIRIAARQFNTLEFSDAKNSEIRCAPR